MKSLAPHAANHKRWSTTSSGWVKGMTLPLATCVFPVASVFPIECVSHRVYFPSRVYFVSPPFQRCCVCGVVCRGIRTSVHSDSSRQKWRYTSYASGVFLPWLLAEGNSGSRESLCSVICACSGGLRRTPIGSPDDVFREAGFESIHSIAFNGAARVVQAALPQHHPLHAYLGNTVPASAFSLVSSVVRISWLREHPLDPLRQESLSGSYGKNRAPVK